ncbi:MAG: hypothetical protein Q4B67_00035 [Eubacteriales bacterium]|nr:hypothetical protein [Eubacteriales bacterium]
MNGFDNSKSNIAVSPELKSLRKEFFRRLITTCALLFLTVWALVSYVSRAWFAKNDEVGADNSSVSSATESANLYIRLQSDSTKDYSSVVINNWETGVPLYPISTADCEDWYYISGRSLDMSVESDGVAKGVYYASEYSRPASIDTDGVYSVEGTDRRAFFCGRYNLYTSRDDMRVYLHPDEPITVNCSAGHEGLRDALRIALVTDSGLVFIFAPVAESGIGRNYIGTSGGNPVKAEADTFYAVTGQNTAAVQPVVIPGSAGLGNYLAGRVPGESFTYADGTTPICVANDGDGANVSVYIWLEGMDAQGIAEEAAGKQINVNVNYVGVPVTAGP